MVDTIRPSEWKPVSKCPNFYGSKVGRVLTRFRVTQYKLVILFTFLAVLSIDQALMGVKGNSEGNFTLLNDHI